MAVAARGDGAVAPRVQVLDGLRGVAVLMVLGYHAGWEITYGLTLETGVDLFFVLSGFLITGILLRTKGRSDYFRLFYARRSLRIFPLYYAFLAISIIAALLVVASGVGGALRTNFADQLLQNQLWGWLYQVNNLLAFEGSHAFGELGHLWSLSVEEQFYLIWPLVVLFVPTDKLLKVSLGVAAASVLFRGIAAATISDGFAYYFTFCRLDGLALGAVGAAAFNDPALKERVRPAVEWVGRFWWTVPLLWVLPRAWIPYGGGLLLVIGYLGLVLASYTGVLAARPTRWLNSRFLQNIGGYCYAIYVFSLPIAQAARSAAPSGVPMIDGIFAMGVTLALSWALAWVSWRVLESPFLRLKSRFAYTPPSTHPSR